MALGRLLDRLAPGAPTHAANGRTVSHSYTYDAAGRMLTGAHGGLTLGHAYDAVGRLISRTNQAGRAVS